MRRAKLAAGSAGSLPTALTGHSVPLCFVCDEPIKSHRLSTSLLAGRTQYTHSPLPTKIGGYIGDEFVVVVTPQDALCKHCMALINTMDRLELELRQHRFQLIQHLKTKYKLDGHTSKPTSIYETLGDYGDVDEPDVIEVSDEEWTPNKKQRTDSTKHHRCTLCSATYTNLNMFMAHLSRHKQAEKTKCTKSSVSTITENLGQVSHFKCGCCSESFSTKESLALHMQLHTGPHLKAKASSVMPGVVNNSRSETMSPAPCSNSLQTEQESNLFEDIEQLSQQQTPVSSGVCSEEQKGRVCLLALLNNGVCSDLSHRVPVVVSPQELPFSSDVNILPKVSKYSDGPTISITLAIPHVVNGKQLSKQQLSLPVAPNNLSNSSNALYPVAVSSTSVISASAFNSLSARCSPVSSSDQESSLKSLSEAFSSDMSSRCLDMPTLSDNCFEDVSQSNGKVCQLPTGTIENYVKKSSCAWIDNDSVENFVSGDTMGISIISPCRPVQGLDMPSLLDEDILQSDEKNLKGSEVITEKSCLLADASGNSTSENKVCTNTIGTSLDSGKPLQDQTNNNNSFEISALSLDSCNKDLSEGNIAVVSVTSLEVNADADSRTTDWFFTHSEKEISSGLVASNGVGEVSSTSSNGFVKNLNTLGGKLVGENFSDEIMPSNKSSLYLTLAEGKSGAL